MEMCLRFDLALFSAPKLTEALVTSVGQKVPLWGNPFSMTLFTLGSPSSVRPSFMRSTLWALLRERMKIAYDVSSPFKWP